MVNLSKCEVKESWRGEGELEGEEELEEKGELEERRRVEGG